MRLIFRSFIAMALAAIFTFPSGLAHAAEEGAGSDGDAPKLTQAQLEQLVAPVALYPDTLLAQTLMASTYPLEVVDAARWLKANAGLKGDALDEALKKQTWDPSVASLVKVPQTLHMMDEKQDWTEQLGNAFLAQPQDVMDAVQRLRAKAETKGYLKSNQQQTVKTDSGSGSSVIVIQSAQPDVVYVPTYNPTVVYGPWPYPAYPPYAWYPPGYVAGVSAISFGAGVAVGYALWGNPDWHHGDVDIDINRYSHFSGGRPHDGDAWRHNPEHRRNVPYANHDVANRFQRPNQGGMSPAQERIKARETFRGHGAINPGGSGAGGSGASKMPGRLERHGERPGQGGEGARHLSRGVGERPDSMGRISQRAGGHIPERASGHISHDRFDGRGSAFSGANRGGGSREFQRGAQSRQSMHARPGGGARRLR